MCSARDNAALPALGFPIRASAGHWPFSASPRLIAAVHALHRLLVPRHPPCALTILTVIAVSHRSEIRTEKSKISLGRTLIKRSAHYPLHWLLCSFQGPRRGETHHTMTRDLVQRAAGGEPVSQNSTARVQSAGADCIGRNLPDRNSVSTAASSFLPSVAPRCNCQVGRHF
jgi:hypothetical protein